MTGGTGKPFNSSYGHDYYGGGFHVSGGGVEIIDCYIHANGKGTPKVDSGTFGGGIYHHGEELLISNCIFADNYAWASGGATLTEQGAITFYNCTIMGNDSTNFFGYQGGVSVANNGDQLLVNSIIRQNGGSQVGAFGPPYNAGCISAVEYCNVEQDIDGLGVINSQPLFTDESNGFELAPNSPGKNAGDPSIEDKDGTRSDIGFSIANWNKPDKVTDTSLHALTVASRNPDSGVAVTVSPADQNGQADGTTQFTRDFPKGTEVTLTAEQTVGANRFKQWLRNGVSIGTDPTVTVTMDYDRTLRAVYEAGSQSPDIVSQPVEQTVAAGSTVTFSVGATGSEPLTYRWRRNGVFLGPATESTTLTLRNAQPEQAGIYRVVVTNAYGEVMSQAAKLTITEPKLPAITKFQTEITVGLGQKLELKVEATGTAPLRYQWNKDGKPVPGADSSMLVIDDVQASDAGSYSVLVLNNTGATLSNTAIVTITTSIRFEPPTINANGNLVLKAKGPKNSSVTFQFSYDLETWNEQLTLPLLNGTTSFTIPTKNHGKLFYRLKLVE